MSNAKGNAKELTLANRLTRPESKMTASIAGRLVKYGLKASRLIVEEVDNRKDLLESRLGEIMEITATVDVNQGKSGLSNLEMNSIITEYHSIRKSLILIEPELNAVLQADKELRGKELNLED